VLSLEQGRNAIGTEGVGALVGALEKMTGLQMLDLVRGVGWVKARENKAFGFACRSD
jgi:hypothetical protein